jgi:hypothetical protein
MLLGGYCIVKWLKHETRNIFVVFCGSHRGDYKECYFMGCDALQSVSPTLTFSRTISELLPDFTATDPSRWYRSRNFAVNEQTSICKGWCVNTALSELMSAGKIGKGVKSVMQWERKILARTESYSLPIALPYLRSQEDSHYLLPSV